MVPGKPQDFPGPHPGFQREEEGLRHLTFDRASKSGDYGAYLQFSYSPAAGWRFDRALYSLDGASLEPSPFPYRNAE